MKESLFGWLRRFWVPAAESQFQPSPREIRSISNADLIEADIPGEDAPWDEWSGIPWFAAFNGYQHWGSSTEVFRSGERGSNKRSTQFDAD
jgi:hypothetical protein